MNLTIAVDDDLLVRAREVAHQRGTSLQELIREQLRTLTGERGGGETARELFDLMDRHPIRSGGRRWRREDAYDPHRIGLA